MMVKFSFLQSLSSAGSLIDTLTVGWVLELAKGLSPKDDEEVSGTWCHPIKDLTPLMVLW